MDELIAFEKKLIDKVSMRFKFTGKNLRRASTFGVRFQFPPFVTSDNKSGSWKEFKTYAAEPIAVYWGGKARDIAIEWVYVIGALGWKVADVESQVKNLRGYYYGVTAGNGLICYFQAYNIVGVPGGEWTFRVENVNITHDKTMVVDDTGSYSLKTSVKLKLKFYTKGISENKKDEFGGEKAKKPPVDVEVNYIPSNPEWY